MVGRPRRACICGGMGCQSVPPPVFSENEIVSWDGDGDGEVLAWNGLEQGCCTSGAGVSLGCRCRGRGIGGHGLRFQYRPAFRPGCCFFFQCRSQSRAEFRRVHAEPVAVFASSSSTQTWTLPASCPVGCMPPAMPAAPARQLRAREQGRAAGCPCP